METVKIGMAPIPFARRLNWQMIIVPLLVLVMALIFNAYSEGVFLSGRNLSILLRHTALLAIMASGVALLMIMSEIDLSIGSAVYLVGVTIATVETSWGFGLGPAIVAGLAIGLLLGLWQGFWVAYVGVPSFIVTLAGLLSFRGIGLYWTNARTISPMSESHVALSEAFIPPTLTLVIGAAIFLLAAVLIMAAALRRQRRGDQAALRRGLLRVAFLGVLILACLWITVSYRGAPTAFLWACVVSAAMWVLLERSVFGRNAYMIGANRAAARLSGINVPLNIFLGFTLMGFLYGISGLLYTARLNASTANDALFLELDAIAACVIGGVALSGGKGRIFAVLGGALLLISIDNGMSVMGVSSFVQQIVKGLILLIAVAVDIRLRRKAA